MFVFISIFIILIFRYFIQDASVIDKVFLFAGFTYGPLLGMYSFGLFTPWKVNDKLVPIVALSSVGISILLMLNSMQWFGFAFGFEILMVNGFITFLGLLLIRNKAHSAIIS